MTLIHALPSRSESRNICEQEGWYFSWCVGKRNSSTSEIRTPASIGLIDILSTPFHSIVPIALSPIAAFLPLLSLLSCHLWSLDWLKFYFSPWWELCQFQREKPVNFVMADDALMQIQYRERDSYARFWGFISRYCSRSVRYGDLFCAYENHGY